MTLVDTSVWIDHFRSGDERLSELLGLGAVLMHPFVLGEIACGRLGSRSRTLGLLSSLPRAPMATEDEVLFLIERKNLAGSGIGYIDAHLLASVLLVGHATLWSNDKALARIALVLGAA